MNLSKSFLQILAKVRQHNQSAGFTMIELLIVIAILGILAVAVLSAINPIEQINRGRDTGSRSDAEQLLSAVDRFHAFQGYYPWQTGVSDVSNIEVNPWVRLTNVAALADANGCNMLEKLSSLPNTNATCTTAANELKGNYVDRVTSSSYNNLYVYHGTGLSDSTYVCFAPQSDAFKQEAFDRLDTNSDGNVDASDNIPADYPADAIDNPTSGSDINCGPDGYCVCLP